MRNRLTESTDVATPPVGYSRRTPPAAIRPDDETAMLDPQAWIDQAGKFVGRHPAIFMAVAVAGGVLLGALIKRRK